MALPHEKRNIVREKSVHGKEKGNLIRGLVAELEG